MQEYTKLPEQGFPNNMTKVLITGATGNVGMAVINALSTLQHNLDIYAGVREAGADNNKLNAYNIQQTKFDFTDVRTYSSALDGCDMLFLLRPPQISEVEQYFRPIINTCTAKGVRHIVFLSVQGVELSSIIPHHKIEKIIRESKIPYTFLRPAYFMQNFTTTLHSDLVNKRRIYLPAGNARFTLIDVSDIGQVAARVMMNAAQHVNKAYELTCNERMTFSEMAKMLSSNLGTGIKYVSPSLLQYYLTKRKEKMPLMLILVMMMLHYLPRFQKVPAITDWVKKITNRNPITFEQFIIANKKLLT